MKSLQESITIESIIERENVSRSRAGRYHPKTKEELQLIIRDKIVDFGPECDLTDIDVSNITDMSGLFSSFREADIFTDLLNPGWGDPVTWRAFNPNISTWNVGNVKDMSWLFYGLSSFNCDISQWDVSNVRNMQGMFYDTVSFDQDISRWNTSRVRNMKYMFFGAKSFDQDLSEWDVSKLSLHGDFHMVDGCPLMYHAAFRIRR